MCLEFGGVRLTYSLRGWIGCLCLVVAHMDLEMRRYLARGRPFSGLRYVIGSRSLCCLFGTTNDLGACHFNWLGRWVWS